MSTKVATRQKPSDTLDTGIDAKERRDLAERLKGLLADTYVLLIKTHVYHWNVVGPLFVPLHELTDKHYNDLFAATDELAERIRALDVKAPLSFAEFLERTNISEETRNRSELEMVENLIDEHEKISRHFREAAKPADEAGDLVTVDLITRRLAFHEKAIWMLRATVGK